MEYIFIAEQAEGNLSGYFPDLPGCVTTAADLPGLLSNAEEALELHLEDEANLPPGRTLFEVVGDPEVQADSSEVLGAFRVVYQHPELSAA